MPDQFTPEERERLGKARRVNHLVAFTRGLVNPNGTPDLARIGANHDELRRAFARVMEIPSTDLALVIVRKRDQVNEYGVFHWGDVTDERLQVFQSIPHRRWSPDNKCNIFTAPSETDPNVFQPLKEIYFKSIVIMDNNVYRIDGDERRARWVGGYFYKICDKPLVVNFGEVLEGFQRLRPTDYPATIALHASDVKGYWELMGGGYRGLFDDSLTADPVYLKNIAFETRHGSLLFRIRQADGELKYLLYSAIDNKPLAILYPGSELTDELLLGFREMPEHFQLPLIDDVAVNWGHGWQSIIGAVRGENRRFAYLPGHQEADVADWHKVEDGISAKVEELIQRQVRAFEARNERPPDDVELEAIELAAGRAYAAALECAREILDKKRERDDISRALPGRRPVPRPRL